jgi:diketogulonate reductase-like aldo/keto reductase/8-oxo-dGTP pyrophosphatase MutT (NUDIX family)
MLQRDNNPAISNQNKWTLIGGGMDDDDLDVETCALRELKEEAGLLKNKRDLSYLFDEIMGAQNDFDASIYVIELTNEDVLDLDIGDEGQTLGFFKYDKIFDADISDNVRKVLTRARKNIWTGSKYNNAMKNVTTKSGLELSKIGQGTWGIGGFGHRTMELTGVKPDSVYIDALKHSFGLGINFTEVSMGYGHGNSARLLAEAIASGAVRREDLFVTHSIYPSDVPYYSDVENDIEEFHRVFATDYADSTLVTLSLLNQFGNTVVYDLLHKLLSLGKTRYVSLSNASPKAIREFVEEFGGMFFAHEGHISFEVRALQGKGVFDTCNDLGVSNIIWMPLRSGKTKSNNWPFLIGLSEKYGKSISQIVLNWLTIHHGYMPMVMSTNIAHIDDNIASIRFKMDDVDYRLIDLWRPEHYFPPEIDWEKDGQGGSIVSLVVDFEKHADIK